MMPRAGPKWALENGTHPEGIRRPSPAQRRKEMDAARLRLGVPDDDAREFTLSIGGHLMVYDEKHVPRIVQSSEAAQDWDSLSELQRFVMLREEEEDGRLNGALGSASGSVMRALARKLLVQREASYGWRFWARTERGKRCHEHGKRLARAGGR